MLFIKYVSLTGAVEMFVTAAIARPQCSKEQWRSQPERTLRWCYHRGRRLPTAAIARPCHHVHS
jgi:hypothetical protein